MDMISRLETDEARKNFYPTPPALIEKLLDGIDWDTVGCALEPSAGKGDIALAVARKMYRDSYIGRQNPENVERLMRVVDFDCIEIDPYLRHQLEERGFRVVHDDFLNYWTYKRYNLIVMNPPFDQGAAHLLHAIELMQNGGKIRCLLNAETIRNPYTNERKRLLDTLHKGGAKIQFLSGEFEDAERKTSVEVALVALSIPKIQKDSTIFDEMKASEVQRPTSIPEGATETEVARYHVVDEMANRCQYEISCGIKLIEEYQALVPHIKKGADEYSFPILEMTIHEKDDLSINDYIRETRRKYWRMLFHNPVFCNGLTSNLLKELWEDIDRFADYDFSAYNIFTLMQKMVQKISRGVTDTIIDLFDKWTARTWNEDSPNRHYYDGWKTNDCFAVGKKVIIPFFRAYDAWSKEFRAYNVESLFTDIEKVFDYLDGGRTENCNAALRFKEAEYTQNTRNIDTKYFTVTFYKKGTAHLVFKDEKLLEKFNIFAAQHKNWLPPTYGKKTYADMDTEERAVIDSFQGREAYEQVMAHADFYLTSEPKMQNLLLA